MAGGKFYKIKSPPSEEGELLLQAFYYIVLLATQREARDAKHQLKSKAGGTVFNLHIPPVTNRTQASVGIV